MRIVCALTKPLQICALAAAWLAQLPSFGAQVTLAWDANTETNIAGYRVWYSTGSTKSSLDVGKVTSATLTNLVAGAAYSISATAYDSSGLESGPSSSISYTADGSGTTQTNPPPSDPTPTPPAITSDLVPQTVGIGAPLQLSVIVTGSQPLTYTWSKNFAPIPGAINGPSFQIPTAAATDGGLYYVAVANSLGRVYSKQVSVSVVALNGVAPTISASPVSQSLSVGNALLLTVQASGSSPLAFQWFRDGVQIPGATGTAFQISSVQMGDAGNYTVRVSNSFGSTTAGPAVVAIQGSVSSVAPVITSQPTAKTVAVGTTLTLSVLASGTGPLTYQWSKDGVPLSNGTGATFQIGNAQLTDAGNYTVQVSNSAGTVSSGAAQVTIVVPPTITLQPVGQSILSGSRVTFTVQASGSNPLQYQWYRDGILLPGATNSTLVIASATVSDTASYSVVVSNGAASVTSSSAQLTVLPPPTVDPPQIIVQPSSQTVTPGTTVTFSVQVTGTAPLLYQWSFNGNPISGANASTLQLSSVQLSNGGSYTVNVSNSAGTAKSSAAILGLIGPPNITTQPQSQTVVLGSALELTVQATGTAPLQFQWFHNNVAIAFATYATLRISSVKLTDGGSYSVNVSNGSGSVPSSAALVTIISIPLITAQPTAQSVNAGSPLNLSVAATGTGVLSYQWYQNGVAIADATSPNYQVPSAQKSDGGQYYVRVSNAAGSVNSLTVGVTVNVPSVVPVITTQPLAQTVSVGSSLTLSVEVTGSAPLQYQWLRNGLALENGTSAMLQIPSVQVTDGGTYTVTVANAAGSASSTPAFVTILTPPVINQQPQSKSAVAGSAVSLAVTASGSAPLTYQWSKNGILLAGKTAANLNITSAQLSDAGDYTVTISNGAGTTNSSTATLTVTPAPTIPAISVDPLGQAIASGTPLSLSVIATGTAPLQYQWFRNGVAIPNAQSSVFQIPNAQTTDSASYSVSISNSAGSVVSKGAVVTVLDPPAITLQPQSKSITAGSTLVMTVTASGSAPLNYQWFKNGTPLSNATGPTLDLGAADSGKAGEYSVKISNGIGSTNSTIATVLVTPAPVPAGISVQPLDKTLASGTPLTLSVGATGSTPLQYQWFRDSVAIQNANTSTLQIDTPKTIDSGIYTVRVSNTANSVTSTPALITILDPPTITQQPQSRSVTAGSALNLAVSAGGSAPLTYQWFKENVLLPGATGATLDLGLADSGEAGHYSVTISNPIGSTNSTTATVLVTPAPVPASISVPLVDQTVPSGKPLTLFVAATGSTPLQYQWFRNGAAIQGANADTLRMDAPNTSDSALYSVKVSNSAGSATSGAAITVLDPLVITQQPQSKSVTVGDTLNLGVAASGSAPLSYQWFKNGTPLPAGTSATLDLGAANSVAAGDYYVKISNPLGSTNSTTATVLVTAAPVAASISAQLVDQTVPSGKPLTLFVVATGSAPLQYQWFRNGAAILGANADTFKIDAPKTSDSALYAVKVSNSAGSATSAAAISVLDPLVITQQPQSKSVTVGDAVNLGVTASGSAPLTYQWFKNGTPLPAATSATLNLGAANSATAGDYYVMLSNPLGSTNSSTATVLVTAAPVAASISVQLVDQTVSSGKPLTLFVVAAGSTPLQYQWFRNGAAIQGANADTFKIDAPKTSDSALYTVKVSNSAGSAASGAAITVLDPVVITQQPQSRSVTMGAALNLAVTASGSAPLSYQWFKNGSPLLAATSATLDLGTADAADNGDYFVVISNPVGSTNSAVATLLVTAAPVAASISVELVDQAVPSGKPLTLFVVVAGSTPLQYQWFRNGAAIPGANADTFRIDAPQTSDSGLYSVKVSNSAGSATSAAAITVLDPLVITQQPQSRSVTMGAALNLAVTASGSAPLSYQWFKNGAPLPAATSATLDLGTADSGDNGDYYVTISNPVGSTNSAIATVQVTAVPVAPRILVQPLDQMVASGSPLTLSVVVTGSTPLQYQWFRNGVAIQNANADTFRIDAPQTSDSALYTVKISNSADSVTSTAATLTVLDPLIITQQPQSKSVIVGSALNLAVTAFGSAPLTYQWFKDNIALPGATSATLDLGGAESREAGDYYVTISNPVSRTNTAIATVLVTAVPVPPSISVQPLDQTVASGKPLLLSVVASGSAPLQYQWFRNGIAIQNANADIFKIDAPQTSDSASYTVKVSNNLGAVPSTPAVITILDAPGITQQPQSQSLIIGSVLNLAVAAFGSAPLTYQWYKDGAPLPGSTSSTLDLGAAQSGEAGDYYVRISNPVGSTNSATATVAVTGPLVGPGISTEPADQTIASTAALTVSVIATGSAPLQYQWFRNGSVIPGANANTFQLASPRSTDSGNYSVKISNSVGSVASRTASITVLDPPSITVQPQSKSVVAGSFLSLSITASGSAPLNYQWLRNGTPISGATSATLNLGSAQVSVSGDYSVKVSNTLGSITSSIATVTVTTGAVAPSISVQPISQSVAPGGAVSFLVQASGTAPLQYQWYRDGQPIQNATAATLQIPAAQQGDAASYTVKVSNAAGSVPSAPAVLTIDASLAPPVITVQPAGQNLNDSSLLSLSVQATGSNLSYQWFHDGVLVPAQSTANYRVASVQASDAGSYNVRVSNAAGAATSISVNVTVTTRPSAPVITKAPIGQTVALGSPITLSVQVTGSAPLQFQWFRNGRALQNGTGATLQIAAAQATDAGDYAVNIANAGGSVSTDPVTVSVILPPSITEQPASKSLATGDSLILSVMASSLSTMTYQWYKDGIAVPNATSATLQINAVQKSNAGGYLVRVSNTAGTITSTAATVTVSDPTVIPSILAQPASQSLAVGSALTLFVQVSGTGPLQYQWYRNAVPIQNANNATYGKPTVGVADAASYTVKVSNSAGFVTSLAAVITVLDPPVITKAPISQNIGQGSPITLTVQATGAPTLTYRWFKDGLALPGANSASFQIGSASTSDSGSYTVQITNGDGSATSTPAIVTVTGINSPGIVTQPSSQTVIAGSDCTFIVEASGVGLRYQWFFDGTAIPNATNALLRLLAVDATDAGDYIVTVSNSAGRVDTDAATLTVNSPPVITSQPVSQTVNAGAALTLRATASGSDPLKYQWLRDGFVVPGATNATLQIASAKATDAGTYVLHVSNDLTSVNSEPAVVVVWLPPTIITQPTSQTLTTGKAVSFTAQAMGVGPLQYQWLLNGVPIPNATSATFQIASAQLSDAGIYTLQVSNAAGSVTSDPAILGTSIANQFAITKQPLSQVLAVGSALNLSVQINGGLALQYQWFRNGIAIGGATSPNLRIGSLQMPDAGLYALRITSPAGILMSDPATIRVVIAPGILVQPTSQSVTAGTAVTLFVQASGSGTLQYQWSKDGVPIFNATGSTFKIPSAQANDAGAYAVEISNEAGSVPSSKAVITILVPPSITKAPSSRSVAPGTALDLTVQATGSGPLLYQWFRNGVVIPGAANPILHFDAFAPGDAGTYAVSVGNPAGVATSDPATISVIAPPVITSQPLRQVLPVGAPLLLTVGFTGLNPQFQWFRDAFPLPGATNSILEIPTVEFEDEGAYRVTISNDAGAVTSSPALIVVVAPPSIVIQPQSLILSQGSIATFSVLADGSDPLSYQWFRNGTPIQGATSVSYSFGASTNNAGSYHVDVTNPLGTISSVEVTLAITSGDSTPSAEPRVEIAYAAADTDLVLQTVGEPGTVYDLQSADQIPPTQWTTVESATAGADGSVQFTAYNPKVDSKFYRVVLHGL